MATERQNYRGKRRGCSFSKTKGQAMMENMMEKKRCLAKRVASGTLSDRRLVTR
jgi:hypothetical protein